MPSTKAKVVERMAATKANVAAQEVAPVAARCDTVGYHRDCSMTLVESAHPLSSWRPPVATLRCFVGALRYLTPERQIGRHRSDYRVKPAMVEAQAGQMVRGHELVRCCSNDTMIAVLSSVAPGVMLKWRSVQTVQALRYLTRDALQVVEPSSEVAVAAPRESPDQRCRGHAERGTQLASAQG